MSRIDRTPPPIITPTMDAQPMAPSASPPLNTLPSPPTALSPAQVNAEFARRFPDHPEIYYPPTFPSARLIADAVAASLNADGTAKAGYRSRLRRLRQLHGLTGAQGPV